MNQLKIFFPILYEGIKIDESMEISNRKESLKRTFLELIKFLIFKPIKSTPHCIDKADITGQGAEIDKKYV